MARITTPISISRLPVENVMFSWLISALWIYLFFVDAPVNANLTTSPSNTTMLRKSNLILP